MNKVVKIVSVSLFIIMVLGLLLMAPACLPARGLLVLLAGVVVLGIGLYFMASKSSFKRRLVVVCLVLGIGIMAVVGMAATFAQNVGMLEADAIVVPSTASSSIRAQAQLVRAFYGNRVQICDGVDDDIQGQAAADTVDGVIRYMSGNYYPNDVVTLDGNDTVKGQGDSTVFYMPAAPSGLFSLDGNKIGVESFKVISNVSNTTATISFASGQRQWADKITVSGQGGYAFERPDEGTGSADDWLWDLKVSNCWISQGVSGLHIVGHTEMMWIMDNTWEGLSNYAINTNTPRSLVNLHYTGNHFDHCGGSLVNWWESAITLYLSENAEFSRNTVQEPFNCGIRVDYNKKIRILDNSIRQPDHDNNGSSCGIFSDANTGQTDPNNTIISGNVIYAWPYHTTPYYPIGIKFSYDAVTCLDNTIEDYTVAATSLPATAIIRWSANSIDCLQYTGTVTAVPGTDQFTVPSLSGFGTGAFANDTMRWNVCVRKDAGGAGAAPQGEVRPITAYTSNTGVFTTDAFSSAIAIGDVIDIAHPSVMPYVRTEVYNPGLKDTTDLEGATKTITATAEASGLGNADYTAALTLSSTSATKSNDVFEVLQIACKQKLTIDSDDGTHDLRYRIYVDVQDANHLLFDITCTVTGPQEPLYSMTIDLNSTSKPVIFNLLKDGAAHTFYWFLWTPGDHAPVISVVRLYEAVGSRDSTYSYKGFLRIKQPGTILAAIRCYSLDSAAYHFIWMIPIDGTGISYDSGAADTTSNSNMNKLLVSDGNMVLTGKPNTYTDLLYLEIIICTFE